MLPLHRVCSVGYFFNCWPHWHTLWNNLMHAQILMDLNVHYFNLQEMVSQRQDSEGTGWITYLLKGIIWKNNTIHCVSGVCWQNIKTNMDFIHFICITSDWSLCIHDNQLDNLNLFWQRWDYVFDHVYCNDIICPPNTTIRHAWCFVAHSCKQQYNRQGLHMEYLLMQ